MWGSCTSWLDAGQLYIGTGYGAAVQLGYMQGGGIGGPHVGQRYRMAG